MDQGIEVRGDRFHLKMRKNCLMIQILWKQNDLPFEMVIFLQLKALREKLFDIHEARCIKDYSCEFTGGLNDVKILCYVSSLPVPLVNH